MCSATLAEYEDRIARLTAELERLKAGMRLTHGGTLAAPLSMHGGATGTVMGVEEMVLQINEDRTVGFLNGPMARLLGVTERKAILGQPLTTVLGSLNKGGNEFHLDVLGATVENVLASNQPSSVESVFPGLTADRLPDIHVARPNSDPVLRLVATPVKGRVQVVVQDVTYLDLRGFTAMCEQLEPEAVRDTINSFLIGMVASIHRYQGTVDKFVGDEVMALFGTPLGDPHHGLNALLCALAMQATHRAWMGKRAAAGLPAPHLGIGVATGKVVVGNIGTPERMDFTVLGSTVNLAARLCGKAEGGEILTVKRTHACAVDSAKAWSGPEALPHIRFGKKGAMQFKNIRDPVEVITVQS